MSDINLSRMELMAKIKEIIESRTTPPAEEMIAMGKALMEIGKALQGRSNAEARAIMQAVVHLVE